MKEESRSKKDTKEKEKDSGMNTELKNKAPKTFNGDQIKSKEFLSELCIYFQLNRKKPDVKNCYSRVLLTLSFIKGANVVNWVNVQFHQQKIHLLFPSLFSLKW